MIVIAIEQIAINVKLTHDSHASTAMRKTYWMIVTHGSLLVGMCPLLRPPS